MKKLFLLTIAGFVSAASFGQFYASLGAGYTMPTNKQVLGTLVTATSSENVYGSYGEGTNIKLNAGYFFNENFGFDLGITYLMGVEQEIESKSVPTETSFKKATATAIGVAPTLVFRLNNGLYTKFGIATKVGGQVEVDIYAKNPYPLNPTALYTETKAKAEVNGKMPLGYTGSLGYQFELKENLGLFVELEYLGINVKRDVMTFTEFDTSLYQTSGTLVTAGVYSLSSLPPGYSKVTTYVDEYKGAAGTAPSSFSPYSSVGLNFGLKYTFGK